MPIVALIPAYRPDAQLIDLIAALVDEPIFKRIVVVDDGSGDIYRAIFDQLHGFGSRVAVLRHAVNLGKGAALKTGMNFALLDNPDLVGVVTADADGQHRSHDIRRIGERLRGRPTNLILGVRGFQGKVPLRSRIGNALTRVVFRAIIGRGLADTQTGLRGIPARLVGELLPLRSNRYEFEMDMLVVAAQSGYQFQEEPIQTVYIADNRGSHFNPFFDSFLIYFTLLRYGFSSSATYVVDIAIFYIAYSMSGTILVAHVLARLGAVALNFVLVRDFVFHAQRRGARQFSTYLGVVLVSGAVSYAAQITLIETSGIHPLLAKCAVESLLFFANFLVLRDLIFSDRTG